MTRVQDNIARVRETIAQACKHSRRDPASVRLVAVSKQRSLALIQHAVEAGVQHFGENRVEEAEVKIPQVNAACDSALTWHMIGHIQSRKAREVPGLFQVVHSVDSLKLAQKLGRIAHENDSILDALVQVNVSGEGTKGGLQSLGWQDDDAVRRRIRDEIASIVQISGLRIVGLMTMAPVVEHMELVRPVFSSLARLRDDLSAALNVQLPEMSMGMTDDYPVAVEEGATMVRIGRAIFED